MLFSIISIERYLMVLSISLELDTHGRCYHLDIDLVPSVTEDFRNGIRTTSSKRYGSNYLGSMMTSLVSTGHGNNLITDP